MARPSRRTFLEQSLLAAAAAATPWTPALGAAEKRRKRRPNDRLGLAVIGVRGRGRGHIGAWKQSPDADVVAICDADQGVIGPAMKSVPKARYYKDLRKLLEAPDIDAVSIATPNHWHSLAAIWALQAGKHVYVEKPVSHNVFEGRQVVEAAKRYGRIVQHGTQSRSATATREAIAWLQSGGLGEVRLARALCYKRRNSIGKVAGPQQVPESLDYDLWTGPAAMQPLMRKNLHYDWHWVFETGNGDLGNQGVHQMDIARWGLDLKGLPKRVQSWGGRVGYVDDGNTPNTQIALYDYGEKQIIFEVRGLKTDAYRGAHIGVIFYGEHGYLVSASYGKLQAFDHDGKVIKTFTGDANHFQNFLDAIKAEDSNRLTAPILEGHWSSALCHLGNISYRLGQARSLSDTLEPFAGHQEANDSVARTREHLLANGLNADQWKVQYGPLLAFHSEKEAFHGAMADQANALLTRAYREPYVVPSRLG
ncbi:MAG: gfo/Idh/MocA family oxidoreductase [Planctomycetota bacterium]|nr:MAG: gfo/Idh/MocA family oxidoreductase [Planctomycetota bacterium]